MDEGTKSNGSGMSDMSPFHSKLDSGLSFSIGPRREVVG